MSTVAQLLTLTDALYPNAASDATVVGYFNMCQNELSSYFGLVAEDTTLYTVADNDSLSFPAGINDISQIISFDVYNAIVSKDKIVSSTAMKVGTYTIADQPDSACRISVTHVAVGNTDTLGTITIAGTVDGTATTEVIIPIANSTVYGNKYFDAGGITSVTGASWITNGTADNITVGVSQNRYDFTRYSVANIDDTKLSGNVIYQVYTSAGVKSLVVYPTPTTTGCNIRIRYKKDLTVLSESSTSVSPDFDSKFHDILAIYAAMMICGSGASPDIVQYNHFLETYTNRMTDLWKYTMGQSKISLKRRGDNKQWH
jgi:hypothetical protein